MKQNDSEQRAEDPVVQLIKVRLLSDPEFKQMVREIVIETQQGLKKEHVRELTRKQLSGLWQISIPTIDRMTDEEIEANGYVRRKRGVSVRFEKLT